MKRFAFGSLTILGIAILALAMSAAPAKADTMVINVQTLAPGTSIDSYSWSGAGAFSITSPVTATVAFNDLTSGLSTSASGTFTFTTGPYSNTTGSGSTSTLHFTDSGAFTFTTTAGVVFSGATTNSQIENQGGQSDLTTNTILGTISAGELTALGAPANNVYLGSMGVDLINSSSNSNIFTAGIINTGLAEQEHGTVTAVSTPENSTLSLLSSGLIGLALLVGFRRKVAA